MSTATYQLHNRIALIFDFDDTLAEDSYDAILRHCGWDPDEFRTQRVSPLGDEHWDMILARFYALIEASRSDPEVTITRQTLDEVGQSMRLFDGVTEMFERVRQAAQAIVEDVEVEFYIVTSGFAELALATPIASEFKAIWGGRFHYDEDGQIAFAKEIITHPEKERYILQLAKGLEVSGPNGPADVYRHVPQDEWYVPLNQMIYVGDGASDMPAFSLLNERYGIALGIFKAESPQEWRARDHVHPGRRVDNLVHPDYSEGSELLESLILGVESIAKRIALRKMSKGE